MDSQERNGIKWNKWPEWKGTQAKWWAVACPSGQTVADVLAGIGFARPGSSDADQPGRRCRWRTPKAAKPVFSSSSTPSREFRPAGPPEELGGL